MYWGVWNIFVGKLPCILKKDKQISIKYDHIDHKLVLAYNGLALSAKITFFIIPNKLTTYKGKA